jgi:Uncharacterized protein conserved in bacteria (DUF2252)
MRTAQDVGIDETTREYETWMARFGDLNRRELAEKHHKMAEDAFQFLRATFYDWAVRYRRCCPEAAAAPAVLGVGDLHVENFGLWRDAEGRLVWGVNDFDEAATLPYTNDLVRLLTSAALATDDLDVRPAATALLTGYATMLKRGGEPFVLAERHATLRRLALRQLGDAAPFWAELTGLPDYRDLAEEPRILLLRSLPGDVTETRVRSRQAGLGSLGRTRATATAQWRGGLVAREVKRVLPSAWNGTATTGTGGDVVHYREILAGAVRCPDPFLQVEGMWVVRRLAPDGKRIELATLRGSGRQLRLLEAMGAETANVHLGSPDERASILADLADRPKGWLAKAADTMARDVRHRQHAWARHHQHGR